MNWLLIALVPGITWGFASICDKILVSRFVKDGITAGILTNVFSAVFPLLLLPFWPIHMLPPAPTLLIFLAGVIWGWNRLAYMKGISLEEATRVVAIASLSPVVILLGSVAFFGEVLTSTHFASFALILTGVIWISLKKAGKAFHFSPATLWLLLSVAMFSAATLLLKKMAVDDWWSAVFLINVGFAAGSAPFLAFPRQFSAVRASFSRHAFPLMGMLLLINAFTLAGRAGYFLSVQLGPAALASVLASLQTAFVFILALLLTFFAPSIIKEDYHPGVMLGKLGAILLILGGIALLYLG